DDWWVSRLAFGSHRWWPCAGGPWPVPTAQDGRCCARGTLRIFRRGGAGVTLRRCAVRTTQGGAPHHGMQRQAAPLASTGQDGIPTPVLARAAHATGPVGPDLSRAQDERADRDGR